MTPEQLERCRLLASSGVVGADIKALLDELKDRAWWEKTAIELQSQRDALAADLAQWKNDNLEIAGKFTKANYRIRDLEAALKEAVMYDYGDDYPPWFEKARALVGFS